MNESGNTVLSCHLIFVDMIETYTVSDIDYQGESVARCRCTQAQRKPLVFTQVFKWTNGNRGSVKTETFYRMAVEHGGRTTDILVINSYLELDLCAVSFLTI